jgi:hypothetical protein
MALSAGAWSAHIAAALCAASRWLSAGSLGLTVCALVAAPLAAGMAFAALAACAAFGGVQLYLAVRIEFDRAIFTAAAQEGFEGFDEALGRLGWRRGADPARPPESRAAGLASLVKRAGVLLAAQLALLLAGLWLLR